jgi:putative lipoprotein
MSRSPFTVTLLLGIALMGCATTGRTEAEERIVTGSVAYRERMALPPDAVIQVSLSDVSRADAAATVVAETTIVAGARQVPIPFALRYDPSRIQASSSYAVRAVIKSGDRMLFTTDAAYRVITQGNPTQANLQLVRASGGEVESGASRLTGTTWVLADLAGTPVVARAPTLEFADAGRVAGNGSCNRFTGSVRLSGESISFSPLAATRMACADSAVSRQETSYFQALQGAERFRLDGNTLLIRSKGLSQPLRFTKQ